MEEVIKETIVVERQPAMTDESLGYLKTSAGWAQFLAIVNFIYCGIVVIAGLFILAMSFISPSIMDSAGMGSSFGFASGVVFVFIGLLYLAIGVIGFMLAYYLFKFSSDAKVAVLQMDTDALTSSMANMKKYFKLTGILTIVMLVLACLWIPVAFFIGLSSM